MRDICWSPLKLAKHTSSYSLNQSSCHKHEGAAFKKKRNWKNAVDGNQGEAFNVWRVFDFETGTV